MTAVIGARRSSVLADLVPGGLARDIALVAGSAALVGISAQVAIPLPVTPVPITLQTFAVLLSGAALGPMRAAAGMLIYLGVGVAGVPWFSQQTSGWAFPTFGYIIGFVLAAILVGALARRGADRSIIGAIALMVLGNLVIYAVGVPYLAVALSRPLGEAIGLGMTPFLIGDGLKILLAAGLLPAAWRLAGDRPAQD
jgi:biotin transport system substrate-specific component